MILHVTNRRLAAAAVAFAALAHLAVACSGGGSRTEQPGDSGSASTAGAEVVALNVLEALVKGNSAGVLQWVRPDYPGFDLERATSMLSGCDLTGVQLVVGDLGPVLGSNVFGTSVVAVFKQPCGQSGFGGLCRSFQVGLAKLSGRWYLDNPGIYCSSSD